MLIRDIAILSNDKTAPHQLSPAYLIITNHVHLLMTPSDSCGVSSLTKVVGSRFASYMNKKYKRSGTLWEGRHKSSVIDTENYLLKCYR